MQKRLLTFLVALTVINSVNAQTLDTVSIGAGYANQVWYSLENDTETSVNGQSWDFAFQINGFSSTILANTAYGAELYVYPFGDTSNWANCDTLNFNSWVPRQNAYDSWIGGAFNGKPSSNAFDLGWGIYNPISHHVVGDSIYFLRNANGQFKKIWIENLVSGSYNYRIADLDGSNLKVKSLQKSQFTGKNFGYYSIAQDSIIDLEPLSNSWDLVFSKYIEDLGIPYSVSGVRTNIGIEAVQVYPVNNPSTYNNAQNQTYTSENNIIGHDWKNYDFGCFCYLITDSTVYFVKTDSNTYWKLIMTDFGGSGNGNFVFEKIKITLNTGINDFDKKNEGAFALYPNPSTNRNISVVTDLPKSIKTAQLNILNINGQVLRSETIPINNSFDVLNIQLNEFRPGIYFMQINHETGSLSRKLILK